jgi:hypothetical protein
MSAKLLLENLKGTDHSEDLVVDGIISNIKMDLRKINGTV